MGDALAAVVAGGVGGRTVDRAIGYISDNGPADAVDAAATGRMVAGLVAGGADPSDVDGTDFVALLEDQYDASSGRFETHLNQLFSNLLAANGWIAAKGDLPAKAVDAIVSDACPGGGFGYDHGCARGPDVDTSSWAINVLVAAGEKDSAVVRDARDFILGTQRRDGGFPYTDRDNLPTSADSTGLVLAAIAVLGESATTAPWRQPDGDDPVRALVKLQTSSGGFAPRAKMGANLASTVSAVPGLAGFGYPILEGLGPRPKPSSKPRPAGGSPSSTTPPTPQAGDDDTEGPAGSTGSGIAGSRPGGRGRSVPSATGSASVRVDAAPAATGESFGRPQESDADGGSPLRSPLLWGGLGLATVIAGIGQRWLRHR